MRTKQEQNERLDFVRYWANYINKHPKTWRKQHNRFINAQVDMANNSLKKFSQEEGGKQKIIEIFKIKNKKVIESL
jgi:hypothetical protein